LTIWESIFLGFLQGVTEFLPISSSGHLAVARNLLGIKLPGIQFEVALHLATLLSVFVVYRAPVKELCLGFVKGDRDTFYYLFMLIVATLPAAFIGLWANELLEGLFLNPWVTIIGFMTTSLVLWSIHVLEPSQNNRVRVTVFTAAMIGLAQAFALVPGISRSGMTVAMALWLGLNDEGALRFSFLASVPVILGATSLELINLQSQNMTLNSIHMTVGMAVAGVTGIFAIRSFLSILRKKIMHRLALYCFTLSAILSLYLAVMGNN
jgi:undecaprenyl-diphosphatase